MYNKLHNSIINILRKNKITIVCRVANVTEIRGLNTSMAAGVFTIDWFSVQRTVIGRRVRLAVFRSATKVPSEKSAKTSACPVRTMATLNFDTGKTYDSASVDVSWCSVVVMVVAYNLWYHVMVNIIVTLWGGGGGTFFYVQKSPGIALRHVPEIRLPYPINGTIRWVRQYRIRWFRCLVLPWCYTFVTDLFFLFKFKIIYTYTFIFVYTHS